MPQSLQRFFVASALVLFTMAAHAEKTPALPLEPPTGWTKSNRSGAVVFTAPNVAAPDAAFLAVLPVQSPEEWPRSFDRVWSDIKAEHRDVEEVPTSEGAQHGHAFRIAAGSMADASGRFLYVTFFAARNDHALLPIVFVATNAKLYETLSPDVKRALNSVRLPRSLRPSNVQRPKLATLLSPNAVTPSPSDAKPNGPSASQPAPKTVSLLGTWSSGSVSPVGFYDASTGSWAPPSGAGQSYELRRDGTFVYAGVLQTSMYGCTTTVSVYNTGTWRQAGGKLVFQQKSARTKSQDNCNAKFNYEKRPKPQTETFPYRVTLRDNGEPSLFLQTEHGELELWRQAP